jgi:hypothetical protein
MHKWLSKILCAKTTINNTDLGKTQPNQQLKLTESADCVKHCLHRFLFNLKVIIMNSFRFQQLAAFRCRSLVAYR